MGREAKDARNARVANVAEYERTVGPTLRFRERTECPKCGNPRSVIRPSYCAGIGVDWDEAKRKLWQERNGCPVEGEHLHMDCQVCGYGWNEYVADDDAHNRAPIIEP